MLIPSPCSPPTHSPLATCSRSKTCSKTCSRHVLGTESRQIGGFERSQTTHPAHSPPSQPW